jgi:hypothetical protein
MKKSIIVFSTLLIVITATAFVGAGQTTNPAEATFQKEFTGATDVKWNEERDFLSASFTLSDSRIIAYFSYEGELLGTERNILFNNLPLAVIKSVNNRFGSAPIFDLIEYTSGTETFYKMYVDTSTKHLKLKVSPEGDIQVEQKTKK